jgi:hypothetical protein
VLAISEYFMLIQGLENIGEGLLHAYISELNFIHITMEMLVRKMKLTMHNVKSKE